MSAEKILIVEDEPALASSLEYGLANEGCKVLWAETGRRALEMARTRDPNLILLDIRLPDISGYDVCRTLRAEGKRQPILMLTARDEETDKVLGLELGADDYVVKPYSLREVISRVRALLRRAYGELASAAPGGRVRLGEIEVDLERWLVQRRDQAINLTPIEFRLLRELVTQPDRPISRDRLIETIWGYDGDIGNDRTIDVHMRHLREKIEDDPARPRWLVTVRGLGYKFSP
jgi:DNA-binding response OmpR family regulator